jgi:hypothetical protein
LFYFLYMRPNGVLINNNEKTILKNIWPIKRLI